MVIDRRCLARSLLPVKQRVAFLQNEVQVVLLECGELAYVTVLVDECHPVKVFRQLGVRLHVGKLPVLGFILPAFPTDQLLCHMDFTHVLFR